MQLRQLFRPRAARVVLLSCLALSLSSLLVFAQTEVRDFRYYTQQAVQAYRAKDYAAYLENMKKASELRPEHPTVTYNLAGAYALNGRKDEALAQLSKVAAQGLIYPASEEEDFASLKDSAEFKAILAKFQSNQAPVNHSREAFRLDEKGLITEGLAFDSATETFYVSSVHRRKILSVDKKGVAREFSTPGDGLWSVLGMKVDAGRRLLWVASAAMSQMMNFTETDKNRAGVFKYDLKSGKLLKKYLLPETTKPHTFGDLAVHPKSGDVYVTDSLTPAIYLIPAKTDVLEMYAQGEPFASPQGLDFSADGRSLFVADYGRGIFVSEVKERKFLRLERPENVALLGLDGLYFHKGSLIAVQNGVRPHRVVRAYLNRDFSRVERLEVIEANNAAFDEPTLGVIAKGEFYFIANSQWGSVSEAGTLAPADKLQRPLILKAKL